METFIYFTEKKEKQKHSFFPTLFSSNSNCYDCLACHLGRGLPCRSKLEHDEEDRSGGGLRCCCRRRRSSIVVVVSSIARPSRPCLLGGPQGLLRRRCLRRCGSLSW